MSSISAAPSKPKQWVRTNVFTGSTTSLDVSSLDLKNGDLIEIYYQFVKSTFVWSEGPFRTPVKASVVSGGNVSVTEVEVRSDQSMVVTEYVQGSSFPHPKEAIKELWRYRLEEV